MQLLGIETSCDDTAAAVVADGTAILSSVVASQIEVHHPFGGVVPELASRKHIEAIVLVVNEALRQAELGPNDLDGVAVTQGPGLVGSLLVGFSFAKAYAYARGLPFTGVNHLLGHIHTVLLGTPAPPFPFVALLVSGGHTGIYHVTTPGCIELMGQTRDDAAGEAFDKVAKMLGLGYPGGVVIDRLARSGDPNKIIFPRSYLNKTAFDFSFSGIKSAVRRYLEIHADTYRQQIADIVAGFQAAVVDVLAFKLLAAARARKCKHVAVVGGVAANSCLRARIRQDALPSGITVHIPPIALCGDNAAMIAAAGFHRLRNHQTGDLGDDVYSRAQRKGLIS